MVDLKYSYIFYTTNVDSIPLSITKKDNKMPNDTISYLQDKTEHDLLVILEGFRLLLADAELFDMLAEKLDLSDDLLVELREDVHNYMTDEV